MQGEHWYSRRLPLLLAILCVLAVRTQAGSTFALRQIYHHGVDSNKTLERRMPPDVHIWAEDGGYSNLNIQTRPMLIERLKDRRPAVLEPVLAAARKRRSDPGFSALEDQRPWVVDTVCGPNVTDRETVINFALMAANAYTLEPGTRDWEDLDSRLGLNTSLDFGWEADGLRGHVYADEKNATVVIGIKGTTRAIWDGEETTTRDKENDNMFFSCCCAQQGPYSWKKVCDCRTETYGCNSTCLAENLRQDHRYYRAGRLLYSNVTALYPDAEIWLTGHSLGGAVASLLGLTYGVPTIAFESPPDALPASRLGIPSPPGKTFARALTGVYHFGHTADPIFMGTCSGSTTTCSLWGYSFESQCHAGSMCTYDTVADHHWRQGIWTHGIREVIKDVLRAYDTLPTCAPDDECVDCQAWNFYESHSSMTSTTTTTTHTSSTSRTRTRSTTCQTPGWLGCRDEKTTATATSQSSTSVTTTTTTTTSCQTPGWFGCKDKLSTTTATTTSGASSAGGPYRNPVVLATTTATATHHPEEYVDLLEEL